MARTEPRPQSSIHLWRVLKVNVHARKPHNLDQLKQFAIEEWAKTPQETCAILVKNYSKRLLSVVAQKGYTIILDVSFLLFLVSTPCNNKISKSNIVDILSLLFWKQIHYKHLLLMVISMEKSRVLSNFTRGANNFVLNCIWSL